jgi:putative alpha-1,2-mannosidase
MVPFDLEHLIERMGGRETARARLDKVFEKLNAGASQPYAWMGNEPGAGLPWIYLSLGQPWKTQESTHRILGTLFNDTPHGLPGNDDMGQMSSWYVWTALGLYPENPAVRILDIGSPLFPHITVHPKRGPQLTIDAPGATAALTYVQNLSVNGKTREKPWIELPEKDRVKLTFHLGAKPNREWGSSPASAPPSYAPAQ